MDFTYVCCFMMVDETWTVEHQFVTFLKLSHNNWDLETDEKKLPKVCEIFPKLCRNFLSKVGIVSVRGIKTPATVCICTGSSEANWIFWNRHYTFTGQLRWKIKLNPSMGLRQYLKSCFRIKIFWKLCHVWVLIIYICEFN